MKTRATITTTRDGSTVQLRCSGTVRRSVGDARHVVSELSLTDRNGPTMPVDDTEAEVAIEALIDAYEFAADDRFEETP